MSCSVNEKWGNVTCVCQEVSVLVLLGWTFICILHCQHYSDVLEVVKPFDLVYKLMTTRFKLVDSVCCGSPFILMTEVCCTSPWELVIVESKLEPVFQYVCMRISQLLGKQAVIPIFGASMSS